MSLFWKKQIEWASNQDNLKEQLRVSKQLLKELVNGIDHWNESMEKVIGRQVDYNWPALEESRKFLKL